MSIQRSTNRNKFVILKADTVVNTELHFHFQYGSYTAGGRNGPTPRNLEACVLQSQDNGQRHFVAVELDGRCLYAWVNDEQVNERS